MRSATYDAGKRRARLNLKQVEENIKVRLGINGETIENRNIKK